MIGPAVDAATLLVATDFDGTLAPIVDDPDDATALPEAVAALERLSLLPRTWVAVVSGRSHHELMQRFPQTAFQLVGEHGADPGGASDTSSEALEELRRLVEEVAAEVAGSRVEHKKRSVAFHYRLAEGPEPALERIRLACSPRDELELLDGKKVLEIRARGANKGDAISGIARRLAADVTLYLGDDVTDETVFARLGESDVGIKVGDGPTAARHRVSSPSDVARLLGDLADRRRLT